MYRLLPTTPQHRLRHYYPRLIAGTNLPKSKGWIAWLAKAECTHITFAQDYYTIESKENVRKWTQIYRVQDQLSANEPTAPYIIDRESNPQPSEQLRLMTIKTSASTETATTAYINVLKCSLHQDCLLPTSNNSSIANFSLRSVVKLLLLNWFHSHYCFTAKLCRVLLFIMLLIPLLYTQYCNLAETKKQCQSRSAYQTNNCL